MLQIIFRGIDLEEVCPLSRRLINELAAVASCAREEISLESIQTQTVWDGEFIDPPFRVQINWFERGKETQQRLVQVLDDFLCHAGYEGTHIYFVAIEPDQYYVNGDPCGQVVGKYR